MMMTIIIMTIKIKKHTKIMMMIKMINDPDICSKKEAYLMERPWTLFTGLSWSDTVAIGRP